LEYFGFENTAYNLAKLFSFRRKASKTRGKEKAIFEAVSQKKSSGKKLAKQGFTNRFQNHPSDNYRG
jgi:hypothetical protein